MNTSESLLPVVARQRKPFFDWKNRLAVAARICLLLLIVVSLRVREAARSDVVFERPVLSINDVRPVVPNAGRMVAQANDLQAVFDRQGQQIATVTSTIPEANHVIGYRGPSHSVLRIDGAGVIEKAALLTSRDTPEHIQIVNNDALFWKQFEGLRTGIAVSTSNIDAVSGATLTSLAIAEGIALRMGQRPGSLKFPDSISATEIAERWAVSETPSTTVNHGPFVEAFDVDGQSIGLLIRTGALVDSLAGYQGPTELLVAVDGNGRIVDIQKRSSWDNPPYVGYLDDEPGFWNVFRGLSLDEVATASLEELEVEGISGATMTSVAAAETVVAAAAEWVHRRQQEDAEKVAGTIHWTAHDLGSAFVVFAGCVMALTRLRSVRWLGVLWNVVLVLYFGLVTGNLISLVLIFGWSASGMAYQLAPGLTLVVAVSLLLPAISKRNVYCSHLCPHGAAQQLLRHRLPKRFRWSRKWMKRLTWGPGMVLVVATMSVLLDSTLNLAAIEPFNAYIWYVSGICSLVLAVTSLIWSSFEPMAWCRYGCGTGRLLDYVRLSASSTRFQLADAVVLVLVAISHLM